MATPITLSRRAAKRTAQAVRKVLDGISPPRGTSGKGAPRDGGYVSVFTITAVGDDTLTCTQVASGLTGIVVAKDYLNRRTPFDGTAGRDGFTYIYSDAQTRVSTKTSDSSTEDQVMTPSYVVGDEVVAMPVGGPLLSEDSELDDVRWLEITTRCWAEAD